MKSVDPLADESGNALARAVGDVQAEWREPLEANRVRTEAAFDAAMQVAAVAYRELQIARNDVAWIDAYQVDAALHPTYWKFPDVAYRANLKLLASVPVKSVIQRSDAHTYSVDGQVLIDSLKTVTDPPPEPIVVPTERLPVQHRGQPKTLKGFV